MRKPAPLRPELASVCRYVANNHAGRTVRTGTPKQALCGVLADLAAIRGFR